MPPIHRLISNAGPMVALTAILAMAAYLRLGNLAENPGWFADEGSNLEVAYRLLSGQTAYMALGESTLMVSRMVVFEGVLAAALAVFGGGIGTLRALTGTLGVISVATLYLAVRRITGREVPAILAAVILAIYPQAIVMSRFGFSYNLLSPLVIGVMWWLWEYARSGRRGWLAGVACAIGIGTISDLWMLAMFGPLVVIAGMRRWRDLVWSLPLAALPFGAYLAALFLRAPDAAWLDVGFVLFRVSGLTIPEQIWNVGLNFTVLLSGDFWVPCAVIGLIVLEPAELRRVSLVVLFVPLVVIGRTVALHGLSAHYMIPLLPVVAFGAAMLIDRGIAFLRERGGLIQFAAIGVIVATPFAVTAALDVGHVQTRFPTAIDPFLTNPAEARKAAEYINGHTSPDDLVIVSPAMSWLIDAKTADVQMAIAATGVRTVHYPAGIPASRWVYDPRIEKARYVVIDDFWRGWGIANVDGLGALTVEIEGWPVVLDAGSIRVYENPDAR